MCVKDKLPIHLLVSMTLLLMVSTFATSVARSQADKDGEENWFIEESDVIIDSINEGELNFLDKPPEIPVHHHHNTIIALKSSIETGWSKLLQCHDNLDIFPNLQIVYNKDQIRDLSITQQKNIGEARV